MTKQIISNEQARAALVLGINKVANTVRSTIGPKGRNVMIQKSWGPPLVTNDGVTVAKEVDLPDVYENLGAQLLKEVATKTNDVAGDGTTTATVLAQALVLEGYKNVVAGNDPIGIKRGMNLAKDVLIAELKKNAKTITEKKDYEQVASISAADENIGKLIAEAISKVGKDGVVTVEEGNTMGLSIDYTEGMNFDRGYISPYMVTNSDTMTAEYKDTNILITDRKLSSLNEILPLVEKLAKAGKKNLVIIAEDIDGEALAMMVVNKMQGRFNFLGIKAPAFGDRRKAMLTDIAVLTGGKVISEDLGMKLDAVELEDLGTSRTISSTKEKTTIVIEKDANAKEIKNRIAQLKNEIDSSDSEYDREKLHERLAKLSGGVGVIKVGAATEVELKEMKHRIEDALSATRAAIEEGIVVGGGAALIHALPSLKLINATGDEAIGVDIVKRAIVFPAKFIAENAGAPADVIIEKIKSETENSVSFGFNAAKNKFGNLLEFGIIDPVKVTRSALEHAISVAGMILTTDAIIADIPEKKDDPAMPPAGMGMPGMY